MPSYGDFLVAVKSISLTALRWCDTISLKLVYYFVLYHIPNLAMPLIYDFLLEKYW